MVDTNVVSPLELRSTAKDVDARVRNSLEEGVEVLVNFLLPGPGDRKAGTGDSVGTADGAARLRVFRCREYGDRSEMRLARDRLFAGLTCGHD